MTIFVPGLKNGEPVEEDDRHRTTYKDGEASLQITELNTQDAASYTCQAVNTLGNAETTSTIHVEEVRHRRKRIEEHESTIKYKHVTKSYDLSSQDTNIPPDFTLPLIDQSVKVGEDITCTVTVTCRPEPDVKWFHNDKEVTRSTHVSFHHDKGVYRMTLHGVNTEDAGEWRCQAVNSYGEEWCSCELKVIESVSSGATKPRVIRDLHYTSASAGSLVRLECSFQGTPTPSIKWYKDRQRIESDGHHKIRTLEEGKNTTSTLVIDSVEVEDTGSYLCQAENEAGCVDTEAKIKVHAAVADTSVEEVMKVTHASLRESSVPSYKKYRTQVAPDFTAKLKDRRAPEGTSVRLNCSVTGIPEPSVKWFHNGKEIFDGFSYTIRNNYGLLSLEIVYTKQSLSGQYRVEAANSEGAVSCSCQLIVEGGEDASSLELDILRPRFKQEIEDITVNEGETAEFMCVASGKPAPTFKWQRDVINLSESRTVQMEYDNQGKATLTLRKVKPSDAGLYYCVAVSRSGRAKCSARLNVKAKSPLPMSPDEYESQRVKQRTSSSSTDRSLGHAPSMSLYLPESLEVVEGHSLKLDCSVIGLPYPLVTWHKGDRGLMYSQRHRIILCGTLHTMEIPSCMLLDKGEYIVRATNTHGTVESHCHVTVLPEGSKVSSHPDYRRDAMREAARLVNEAPFFIKHLPKTIDVQTGVDVRLDCILRRGIEMVRWSPDSADKLKADLEKEGFSGEMISTDKNISASSASSSAQDSSKGPKFVKTPTDTQASVGGEAVFEATVEGEPQVKWCKDGRVLLATDSVRISSSGSKHKLRLTSLLESDQGLYECHASNSEATNSCSARLSILSDEVDSSKSKSVKVEDSSTSSASLPSQSQQPTPSSERLESPSFSQDLAPSTKCTEGDSLTLTCKVKGDVSKVTWAKDDKEIESSESSYQIHSQVEASSSLHLTSLTIPTLQSNEHSGSKFTCTVISNSSSSVVTETVLEVAASSTTASTTSSSSLSKTTTSTTASPETSAAITTSTTPSESTTSTTTAAATKVDGDDVSTTKTEDKPTESSEEDFKPMFTTPLKDTCVKDGEGLLLECDIEGNPRPQISWFRDGYEILDSQDFEISMIGSHCKLQVADIYPEDEGKYSVKAVNCKGETTSACYVTVEDPYMSTDSASTTTSNVPACSKSKVTK